MKKELKPKKIKSFFPYKTGSKHLDSTVVELCQMGLHLYENISEISGLLVSSDNKFLVTWSSFVGILLIWNISTQIVQNVIKQPSGILTAKLTPNGVYLIISTGNQEVLIYDFQRFRNHFTFRLKKKIFLLQTTEEEDRFYGIDITNTILNFHISNKKIKKELHVGTYDIKSFDICSSKNLLAFGTRSGFVAIIDLTTKSHKFKNEEERCCTTCIKIHPTDPLVFVSFMDYTIKVFSYSSEKPAFKHVFKTKAYIWDFVLIDKQVISRSHANLIEKWEFSQLEPETVKTEGEIASFCIGSETFLFYSNRECFVIGMDLNTQLKLFKIGLHSKKITVLLPWESKKCIVTASKDKTIRVWDFLTFKCLGVNKLESKGVYSMAISKKENFLIACCLNLKIIVFKH